MVRTMHDMEKEFRDLIREGIDPKQIADEIDALANRYQMNVEDRISVMIAVGMLRRTPREGSAFAQIADAK